MDTPKYSAKVIVGGPKQTTQFFDAFPKPSGNDTDVIITKQSGELELTFVDAADVAFDISALANKEAFVVPFNSDVTPVSLGVGVVLSNVYTITWTKDTIPDEWSAFAQDRDGAIVLYVQLDETGDDYFQTFTRFNVDDGDFKGDAQTVPLIVFDYTWNTAISSEWAKYDRGTPITVTKGLDYLSAAGKSDWGHVVDKDLTTAPAGVDNEQYIIAGIGGLWSGFTIGDIVRFSAADTIWYSKTPIEGDEVYVTDEDTRYQYDGAAWNITGGNGDVVGPGSSTDDNLCTFNLATGKLIQDSGVNISAVTANTAKVTNANHTGDATGSTALTLATVNSNVGSFTNADVTVNAKGLITAVSNGTGGGAGSDTTAIHDDTAGEISVITEKLTPTTGDWLIIEDAADSNNKKRVNVTNLPTGGGGEANTASNVGGFSDVFKTKSGIDLQFKTLQSSDSSLTLTGNTNDVDLVINQSAIAAGTDNNQTGTTYTLVLTDADNKTVWMNNAASNTLTIPLNASVAFATGAKINVMMEGAGFTSITGDTGVTVNGVSAGSGDINNQYQGVTLTKRANDTWIATGDIGTVS